MKKILDYMSKKIDNAKECVEIKEKWLKEARVELYVLQTIMSGIQDIVAEQKGADDANLHRH
jgi:hypothetical protein